MQRVVAAKHIFHNAICQQPFTTFHAQWSLFCFYANLNQNVEVPCGPAMLSRRKSSGDPPETLRGGVSGFFG